MTTAATEGTQISEVTDDLEAFSAQLYGTGGTKDEGKSADPAKPTGDGVGERTDGETEGDGKTAPNADTDDPDAEDAEEKPEEVEKRKRSTSERIKKLTANVRQAERQNAELLARITALEAGAKSDLTVTKSSDTTDALQEPDPAKYKFGELDPQYMRDLAKFEVKNELLAVQREQDQARQTEAANREADQVRQKAAEVTQAGQAKFSDFEEVVVEAAMNGEFALTQEMFETAAETAVAPEILYYLAQNPEESAKVAGMNPRQQNIWFGRMAEKFSQPAQDQKKKLTTAPPPPASLPKGSGGKGGVSIYDLDDPRALDAMTQALFGKG